MRLFIKQWHRKIKKSLNPPQLDPRTYSFLDSMATETDESTLVGDLTAFMSRLRPSVICDIQMGNGPADARVDAFVLRPAAQASEPHSARHVSAELATRSLQQTLDDLDYERLATAYATVDECLSAAKAEGTGALSKDGAQKALHTLDSAKLALGRAGLLLVEVAAKTGERSEFGAAHVLQQFMSAGFMPIKRSRVTADWRCKVLLAKEDLASRLFNKPDYRAQGEIPVLIPCFNNPTYCAMMLDQLWAVGFRDIRFVDNASDSAAMRSWLSREDARRQVVQLTTNKGPNAAVFDERLQTTMPRLFCITDPDIRFNAQLPATFLASLRSLTQRHAVGKAGFALDISRQHAFIQRRVTIGGRSFTVPEWEERFWRQPLHVTDGGDTVFNASVDTTFALVDKKFYRPSKSAQGIRVAGRFTAEHLPWLAATVVPQTELAHYATTQRFSNYNL